MKSNGERHYNTTTGRVRVVSIAVDLNAFINAVDRKALKQKEPWRRGLRPQVLVAEAAVGDSHTKSMVAVALLSSLLSLKRDFSKRNLRSLSAENFWACLISSTRTMPPLSVELLEALIVYALFSISTNFERSGELAQPARSRAEEKAMAK